MLNETTSLSPQGLSSLGVAAEATRPKNSLAALSRLRQRLRSLRFFDGLVLSGLFVTAGVIVSFVLDYFLVLPVAVRGLFLVSGVLGILHLVFHKLLAPLSSQVSDEDLALLVEDSNPELRQSLVTVVQLSRQGSEGAQYVSSDLLSSVVEEVEKSVSGTAFDRVFKLGRLYRKALLLLGIGTGVVFGAASSPELVSIWFQRDVLLGAGRWPKGTVLELPRVPETVATGDTVRVEVRVLRGNPKTVEVRREIKGGDRRANVMDRREKASWDIFLEDGASAEWAGSISQALAAVGLTAEETIDRGRGLLASGLPADEAKDLFSTLEATGKDGVRLEGYDVYVHEFKNVSRPLRFWVEGGDDQLGPFDVQVRLRPRIDMKSIELKYRLPAYTGEEAEERVQRHGNLKVPVGTHVTYSMSTNVPVRRAYFILRREQDVADGRTNALRTSGANALRTSGANALRTSGANAPQRSGDWIDPGAVSVELEDQKRFGGSFVVSGSGYYYFQFDDEYGFRSVKPERFRVQAIPDRKPQVQIVEPKRSTEQVSPEAKVKVRVSIKDDYGIRSASLEGGYFRPGKDTRISQSIDLTSVAAATPAEARSQASAQREDVEIVIDVTQLQTQEGERPSPGARFEFFALAEDFGETGQFVTDESGEERPRGNIGESRVHVLEIVDKAQLERSLTDQLLVVRDQLRQILGRQEAVRRNLETFQDQALLQGAISKEEARKLSRHRRDQMKIGEGLDRQAGEVTRILEKMESNSVGNEEWKRWVSDVGRNIEDIAQRQVPAVETEIDQLRRAANESSVDPASVTTIIGLQRQVERDLMSLVLRLEEFGDKSALLQLLRDVKKRQEEVRDRTREVVGGNSAEEDQ